LPRLVVNGGNLLAELTSALERERALLAELAEARERAGRLEAERDAVAEERNFLRSQVERHATAEAELRVLMLRQSEQSQALQGGKDLQVLPERAAAPATPPEPEPPKERRPWWQPANSRWGRSARGGSCGESEETGETALRRRGRGKEQRAAMRKRARPSFPR
jgi:hypothetical protein